MKRSGACFLGKRPASLLVSSMQQSGTTACCVVLSNEGVSTMNITVIVRALTPLADAFEYYGMPYHLTGSLASSVYVKAQAVQGIEVVSDITFSQVPALVVQLENTYDVKEIVLRAAIEHRGSFRLVHHDTLQRIDVALSAYRAYSRVKQGKVQRHALEQGSRAFTVASPEDTILTLLERYNGGVQRFQRLWESIVEILVMRGSTLDLAYLRLWATTLDVALLLEQALATAGLSNA
jgi:hypothetical protein